MADVFLISTNNRLEGMKAIFSHFSSLFDSMRDKHVVIKPNFNTADPPPASTDIKILRDLIIHLKDLSAKKITIAERSGPVNTQEAMESKGLFDLQKELGGFDIIDLSTIPESEYIHFKPEKSKSHWKNGFHYAKIYHQADAIITLPCLKTHQFGGHFTLSLKLSVGLVPREPRGESGYMKELHSSPHQRSLISEINQVYSPTLVILDGRDAFIDGGPDKGTLVHPKVMLASTDRIAIDAVGVAILRDHGTTPEVQNGSIFEQEQIKRASELGLGVQQAADIVIKSADEKSSIYAQKIQKILI
ncbi:MAG: DUF362 domain-containing protein [Candidatus Hodarchaeales archaeon]|jgi:uncharacterized protein (DUF362 family)